MSKLLLASALVAALCGPALAQNTGGNGGGNQNQNQGGNVQGAPGPVAGAGLTGIAIALGGLGIYWVVTRRQRQI